MYSDIQETRYDEQEPRVHILGLEILKSAEEEASNRRGVLLEKEISLPTTEDGDDDEDSASSSYDSDVYANYSIRQAHRKNSATIVAPLRLGGRRRKVLSSSSGRSFANDSLDLAREEYESAKQTNQLKDRLPYEVVLTPKLHYYEDEDEDEDEDNFEEGFKEEFPTAVRRRPEDITELQKVGLTTRAA